MNAPAFFPRFGMATRHRFTVDDVDRMVEAGVIDRDASTELLDGELIDMPSEGEVHITFKSRLNRALVTRLGDEWAVIPDSTMHLSREDAPEPDFYILPAEAALKPVDPSIVVLVIEISDTSLPYDLGRKASKYANYGLGEYWVVDVSARQTHIMTKPGEAAYGEIASVPFAEALTPRALPTFSVRFDDLVPPTA